MTTMTPQQARMRAAIEALERALAHLIAGQALSGPPSAERLRAAHALTRHSQQCLDEWLSAQGQRR
ncbi:hypothetical protein [Ferrimonas balearica]|uniref:hypothetical protein n=1 Tax=Ferrimonas balearica TaxID=44012 RepID=UPI001C995126|nr:hypothetical protein [Ferrimonas balearica]MBY5992345.1 hypothetical protein [Ferrimonas balearica]